MMSEPWVGWCHVRALTTEQQRWIGNREAAFARLMLTASSMEDFEAGLRHALPSMGYDLVAVISAAPVAQAEDLGALADRLASLLQHVGRVRPVPLGEFAEVKTKSAWRETSWEALLAQKTPLWALIDGVNWPEVSKLLGRGDAEHICLYSILDPESLVLAPWLVRLSPDHPITVAVRNRPQDSHSLILLQSDHATVGDRTACGAVIVTGSPACIIDGRSAAILGSQTSHGGTIIEGSRKSKV